MQTSPEEFVATSSSTDFADIADHYERFVVFPASTNDRQVRTSIRCSPSIVVLGANGSGKTRLGVWFETVSPYHELVHRIPAQRSLSFPKIASPIGLRDAHDRFQWAERPPNWDVPTWERNRQSQKLTSRYGNVSPDTIAYAPLSDYDKLLVLLFSENYGQLIEFNKRYKSTDHRIDAPETILDRVKRVWESVLPHRTLDFESSEVVVRQALTDAKPYSAAAMSDGERAVFYLVGQCLCASPNTIIVIDEPELHLHRAIQQKLWDTIEAERHDCQFIYITHDLAFAEGRADATKIWLRSSDGSNFDWFELPQSESIPQETYLEILGSRRPVAFVEGNYQSIDYDVCRAAFPGLYIRPVGGCATVLAATKAFRETHDLHHIDCVGIVDRDHLSDGQINGYQNSNVYALKVSEIENLFLVPAVLNVLAKQLDAPANAVELTVEMVFSEFSRMKQQHALELTRRDITLALGRFDGSGNIEQISTWLNTLGASIDVPTIFQGHLREAERLIEHRDYIGILRVFNHKGMVGRTTGYFGLTIPSYIERARRRLRRNDEEVIAALRPHLPDVLM
ncbi:AAA family ATPase [Dyella sp. S184]|uniref:AAA family ATPase n=1 Tax=Dyella sp. S184 TaxID=1641862 RepID=UPI00131C6C4F|nr:AAA family ATPase [Dyella sp. S184]